MKTHQAKNFARSTLLTLRLPKVFKGILRKAIRLLNFPLTVVILETKQYLIFKCMYLLVLPQGTFLWKLFSKNCFLTYNKMINNDQLENSIHTVVVDFRRKMEFIKNKLRNDKNPTKQSV